MVNEYQIRVEPQVASSTENIARYVAHDKGIDVRTIKHVRILKRSIDARQRRIFVNLKIRVYVNEMPQEDEFTPTVYSDA